MTWSTASRAAVLVAMFGVVALTATPPRAPPRSNAGPALPRAEFLNAALPGQRALLADFYWILLAQQVGVAHSAQEYRDVFAYADLVTDLDPRFLVAYRIAAISIPVNLGRESFANGDETRTIIEKGLKFFPTDVPLRFNLAHVLMYIDRDYRRAAEVLRDLAREPNASEVFGQLATRLFAQAGDFDAGLEFAHALRAAATSDEQRQFYERRVKEIEAERVLQQIDVAAFSFFKRNQRQPKDLYELLAAGDLPSLPADPLGGAIFIDDFGRARSTAAQFRLELYESASKTTAPQAGP